MRRAHGGAADPALLDFSANINPLGPPAAVRALLAGDALSAALRYPSPDARELCAALAEHHGVPPQCVLAGNGASELIYLIARSCAGLRVYIERPAFGEYEDACLAHGVELVSEPGAAHAIFLGNPASPGGELRRELAPRAPLTVVDESFLGFADESVSLVARAALDPAWIALRSLTKLYAIPGLRAGYLVAHPERVRALRELQPPWSVNALASAAAIAALGDRAYLERTRVQVTELRTELCAALAARGLAPSRSAANYLCCRVPDAAALCSALLAHGIAARDCTSFSGLEPGRHVRFAVRPRAENLRLLAALDAIAATRPAPAPARPGFARP